MRRPSLILASLGIAVLGAALLTTTTKQAQAGGTAEAGKAVSEAIVKEAPKVATGAKDLLMKTSAFIKEKAGAFIKEHVLPEAAKEVARDTPKFMNKKWTSDDSSNRGR